MVTLPRRSSHWKRSGDLRERHDGTRTYDGLAPEDRQVPRVGNLIFQVVDPSLRPVRALKSIPGDRPGGRNPPAASAAAAAADSHVLPERLRQIPHGCRRDTMLSTPTRASDMAPAVDLPLSPPPGIGYDLNVGSVRLHAPPRLTPKS